MTPRAHPVHDPEPEDPPYPQAPLPSEAARYSGRGNRGGNRDRRCLNRGLLLSAVAGLVLGVTALICLIRTAPSGGSEPDWEVTVSSPVFFIAVFLAGWASAGLGLSAFCLARRARRRATRRRTTRRRMPPILSGPAPASRAAPMPPVPSAMPALLPPGEIEHARLRSLPPFDTELLILTDLRIMRLSTDVTGDITRLSEQTVRQLAHARGEEFRGQVTVTAEFHNGSSLRLEGTHPVEARRFVSSVDGVLAPDRRRRETRLQRGEAHR